MSQFCAIRHQRARLAGVVVALLALVPCCSAATADSTVNFWLSNADLGFDAPVIYALPGAAWELKVWARPATDYVLSAFSLNLVAEPEGAVSFTSIEVDNPELEGMAGTYRHQLVFDSAAGLVVQADEIFGFSGFSAFSGGLGLSDGAGIGPNCGMIPVFGRIGRIVGKSRPSPMKGMSRFDGLYLEIGTQGV
jgi:hypothetical protein